MARQRGNGEGSVFIHDLRHTYATRLFANNKHVRAVQELMGHSRSDMTMEIYTARIPEALRDATDSVDARFTDRRARFARSTATTTATKRLAEALKRPVPNLERA
jgi:hypothetical protein